MTPGSLLLLGLVVLVSALCSGLEVALLGSNKLYIELQRKQGALWARVTASLLKKPARVVSALLVGHTIALVTYGILMAQLLEPPLRGIHPHPGFILVAQVLLSTVVILVLGEFLPKALFRMDPNAALTVLALPLAVIYTVLWLPTVLLTGVSEGALRLVGVKPNLGRGGFGRIDLDAFLQAVSETATHGNEVEAEVEYFRNTLELSNTKVRDLMVPRAEIEALDVEEPVSVLAKRFQATGLTKLLVYKAGIDNVIGYVHSYEMFKRPRSIRSILRTVDFIPGTMPADEVLHLFTKQRTHIAVVVDEFGGTAGMLTIEDVVETIVGDIEDEHDDEDTVEERISPTEFLFSGRVEVEHLVEAYGLRLPESVAYDTLAGYIMHRTGNVPEAGEAVEDGPFRLTIAQVSHGRIDLVKLLVQDVELGFEKGSAPVPEA
ncbi:MAG: HlyC/CorC family transporter [Flavobacteriales bacterium]|nr:HlyC/CorC family transporter [Flavobacteriales bacterium]MBP9079144.1 HlyC/CorC family transporter [Flavobacteriales bacterium]